MKKVVRILIFISSIIRCPVSKKVNKKRRRTIGKKNGGMYLFVTSLWLLEIIRRCVAKLFYYYAPYIGNRNLLFSIFPATQRITIAFGVQVSSVDWS